MSDDPFTLARFQPLVGSRFALRLDDAVALPAELVDARAGLGQLPGGRLPFSLTFEAPADPALPQCIYRVEHPALEAMDIFLVPLGRKGAGMQYEAIFS